MKIPLINTRVKITNIPKKIISLLLPKQIVVTSPLISRYHYNEICKIFNLNNLTTQFILAEKGEKISLNDFKKPMSNSYFYNIENIH